MDFILPTRSSWVTSLDANEDRNDHRGLLSLLHEEAGDDVSEFVFHDIEVNWVHALGFLLNGSLDEDTCFREKLLVLAKVHEATRNDVWRFAELAVLAVDGCDDDEHTVLGKGEAITQYHLLLCTDREAVDEDEFGRNLYALADKLSTVLDVDDGAVVGNDNLLFRETIFDRGVHVALEVEVVAVNWYEKLWLYSLVNPDEFSGITMARRVDVRAFVVDDTDILTIDVVLKLLDSDFVAWDD